MSFSVEAKLTGNYFQEVMNAQTEMVRTYLDNLDSPLIFSPYFGTMMATFRFYFYDTDDTYPLLHYTFSICNLVFSHLQDLKFRERQAFNRFSCLHQVLKKIFP